MVHFNFSVKYAVETRVIMKCLRFNIFFDSKIKKIFIKSIRSKTPWKILKA